MSAPTHTAWIAGATGLVGGQLLAHLLDDERYGEVVAFTRRPLDVEHRRLRTHLVDFSDLPGARPEGEAHHLFCCLGTTRKKAGSAEAFRRVDLDFVVAFAEAGRAAGATRFVLNSSAGADAGAKSLYLRTKGEAELAVEMLGFEGVDIARPGLLMGHREELRVGERLGQWATPALNPLMMGALRRWRSIDAGTVAAAMHQMAWRSEGGVQVHHYDALCAFATR